MGQQQHKKRIFCSYFLWIAKEKRKLFSFSRRGIQSPTQPHQTQALELQPHVMSVSVLVPEGSWRMPTPTHQPFWWCWATPQQCCPPCSHSSSRAEGPEILVCPQHKH